MTILAMDLGKTGCRAVRIGESGAGAVVATSGARGLLDREGLDEARHAVVDTAARLARADEIAGLAVGAAGLGRSTPQDGAVGARAAAFGELLAEVFPYAEISLFSDMTSAHVGALSGGAGVVMAAGTGTVALAVAENADAVVVDGWGYLLGDDGSGYAIGRAGLAGALRHHDGRGGSAVLAAAAESRFGELVTLPAGIHGSQNPAAAIAAFAPAVLAAAAAGDPVAQRIRKQAVDDLARTTAAAVGAFPAAAASRAVDVAVLGGLLDDADLCAAFVDALATTSPAATLRPAAGSALDGAARLAVDRDLPHERLVRRRPAAARVGVTT